MKKNMFKIGLVTLLGSAVALAATIGDNTVKLGKSGSSSNKEIIFDTGNGTTNKKLQLNHSTKELSATSNDFKLGDAAASSKKITFDRGSNNPVIRWNESTSSLEFTNDGSNYTQIGSGSGGGSGLNLLSNDGFESGVSVGWTSSGGTFAAATGGNILIGNASATFDASATSQYIESSAYTVPNGLYGRSCEARMIYLGGDANLTMKVLDGSSAAVSGASDFVLSAVTTPRKVSIYFPCPTSGSIKLRVVSTANAAIVALDKMHLGEADFSSVAQSTLIGSAYFPTTASCTWSRTNTSIGAFSTTSACPGPTVEYNPGPGTIQTTDADLPQVTVANLPDGFYEVRYTAQASMTGSNAVNRFAITDGTTTTGYGSGPTNTGVGGQMAVVGYFSYSSSGSRTFALNSSSTAGNTVISLDSGNQILHFSIKRWPTTQEQVFRPETLANSWSGKHGNDCFWQQTQTNYTVPPIDSSCTFSERQNVNFGTVTSYNDGTPNNNYPGITFTPSSTGKYFICVAGHFNGSQVNAGINFKLANPADTNIVLEHGGYANNTSSLVQPLTMCGVYNATSTASQSLVLWFKSTGGSAALTNSSTESSLEWSIFKLDQPFPAPVLTGGMTTNSTGLIRYAGFIGNVNGSSSSVVSQTGTNAFAYSATGANNGIITWSIAAGTFSATPICNCNYLRTDASTTTSYPCMLGPQSSTSLITILRDADAGTAAFGSQEKVSVTCHGAP